MLQIHVDCVLKKSVNEMRIQLIYIYRNFLPKKRKNLLLSWSQNITNRNYFFLCS